MTKDFMALSEALLSISKEPSVKKVLKLDKSFRLYSKISPSGLLGKSFIYSSSTYFIKLLAKIKSSYRYLYNSIYFW
jgi:hypothetical protein